METNGRLTCSLVFISVTLACVLFPAANWVWVHFRPEIRSDLRSDYSVCSAALRPCVRVMSSRSSDASSCHLCGGPSNTADVFHRRRCGSDVVAAQPLCCSSLSFRAADASGVPMATVAMSRCYVTASLREGGRLDNRLLYKHG